MPTNIREIGFEEFIESHLLDVHSYIKRSPQDYDKDLCLDRELVLQFVKGSQPDQWQSLVEQYGDETEEKFFQRLASEIKERGLLDVLRVGIRDRGTYLDLAFYKPNSGLNKETQHLYQQNIFSVVRQLKYSHKHENSIDMLLFLNGLPIFTVELKNQLTGQNVNHSMKQYRQDRDPKNEALLSFKRCLTHFAVDTEQVYMTTQLRGLKTFFLPFNKGDKNSAGNPVNPDGYKTAYLWEEMWSKDRILELISRFIHLVKERKIDKNGKPYIVEKLIFPRYHQIDTVLRLIDHAKESTSGKNYLIQHSAGSGKSNTIAWTAHHFAELHTLYNQKIFNSVIIITDRRVLDRQLQETVTQFEQVRGVVRKIDQGSWQLKDAIESGEKIIISTLQKFPQIVEDIQKQPDKRYAVIIDEAHSSQSGEGAKSLKQVLSTSLEEAESADEANQTTNYEEMILNEIRSRGKVSNVSFFAFTATPKQKTLELFGEKQSDGTFKAFSTYSMKQAIEEGFILDVLKHYTTFKVYFKLLKKISEDPTYQKKPTVRKLVSYVDLHEHAIESKVEIMVDHFMENIAPMLEGRAKAMIVTKSRLHAVRYKMAVDTYVKEKQLGIKTLVAFSGTVKDKDTGLEYTEAGMNGIPEKNTAEEFNQDEYKILIVAEKFQTGFDQPLLSAMYVDKKLGGVNAVQTLSRLNRTAEGKEDVFVLDFVNETDDIQKSFEPYYKTTILSESTDPNILHDLHRDIMAFGLFSQQEVRSFAQLYHFRAMANKLNSFLDSITERFKTSLDLDQRDDLRRKMTEYVRKYAFIAQLITFEDPNLEELYIFLRLWKRKLPNKQGEKPIEVDGNIDLHSFKIIRRGQRHIKLGEEDGLLDPLTGRDRGKEEDEKDYLSHIVKDVNDRFTTDFSEEDRLILSNLTNRLMANKDLMGTINNNPKQTAKIKFDEMFAKELLAMFQSNFDLYQKLDSNTDLKKFVNERMFEFVHKKLSK